MTSMGLDGARAPRAEAAERDCPLCGHRFIEGAQVCVGCPLHGACGAICCPRCGYQFVERSATLDLLRGLTRRLRGLFSGAGAPGRR